MKAVIEFDIDSHPRRGELTAFLVALSHAVTSMVPSETADMRAAGTCLLFEGRLRDAGPVAGRLYIKDEEFNQECEQHGAPEEFGSVHVSADYGVIHNSLEDTQEPLQ